MRSVSAVSAGSRMFTLAVAGLLTLAGCTGLAGRQEKQARGELEEVGRIYRPGDQRPALPELTQEVRLDEFVHYALLNNPRVEAAFYDWWAAVEQTTTSRSLPDPRLTFEADIADTVTSVMPGLMIDLPGPGKLSAAAGVAVARSQGQYFQYEAEVLRTALAVKTAYYRLWFVSESLRIQRQTLALMTDLEQIARQQHAADRATLQDVLRAQIERDRVQTRLADLEDSRGAVLAELKAALGIAPDRPDPPLPARFEMSSASGDAESVMASAFARNPQLRQMEAEVRQAQGSLDLARKSGVPDFTLGIEADVRANPVFARPSASMTLPIWRDKIAAQIAAAQAGKRAAQARLSAQQIQVAADLAATLYMYRQSERSIELLTGKLIPKGRQSLQAAQAGYVAGKSRFLDVLEAQRMLLEFELSLAEAQTQRELALGALSLTIAGIPPAGGPVLAAPSAGSSESQR